MEIGMNSYGRKARIKLRVEEVSMASNTPILRKFEIDEYMPRGKLMSRLLEWLFRNGVLHPSKAIYTALNFDLSKYNVNGKLKFRITTDGEEERLVLEIRKDEKNV